MSKMDFYSLFQNVFKKNYPNFLFWIIRFQKLLFNKDKQF